MKSRNSRDPVSVTIGYLGDDGCGYSADGKYAVYGALPGETVTALPIARNRRRLYGRALSVTNISIDRVPAECAVADVCGGCSFQHLHPTRQLELKAAILKRHLGDTQPHGWLPPVQAQQYHYRSKARLSVRFVTRKGRVLVGFREKQKPYVTDTGSCPVLCEPVDALIAPMAALIESLSDPRAIPQIEVAMGDEAVALVFRHQQTLTDADRQKLSQFAAQHHLHLYLQPGSPESTHKLYPADDQGLLSYYLPAFGLRYRFGPHDFTQVNLAVNRLMVQRAVELLECQPDDRIVDGFCGIGNFSLAAAQGVAWVMGLEQSRTSVERARQNARDNGLGNVVFHVADLHEDLSGLFIKGGSGLGGSGLFTKNGSGLCP